MGSNGGDEVMVSGSTEATVEIKIKTLDSQTYTLRVDKCVPVPALKEQIATVTGVLSEQQRLICRGKVLKDDQLLSAYHVEDGHTLHLVVRQPIPLSSESLPNHSATDPASSTGPGEGNQAGPSVVVGTFNISEQGDGVFPDLDRVLSAVLGSLGITNVGIGSEGADTREPAPERLSRTSGLGGLGNSSRQQPDLAATMGQSNPHDGASTLGTAVPLGHLQPPVIPDSLTTLSQYLRRMKHEFSSSVRGQSSHAPGTNGNGGQESDAGLLSATGRGGLPTPASLAEVMLSTRQILLEQAGECLSQLTRQLEEHTNVTDPIARMNIQSNAARTGVLLQNLGALLLELGRTTMTLRMGQTPVDAVVNAGPAVFISTSGPNPIMVQPLPFQPGTSFGAIPVGNVQSGSGFSGGSLGSGLLSRNIDIRIRTGSLMPSAAVSQMEQSGAQPSPGQSNQATSGGGNSVRLASTGASGSPSSTRESEVRVVPIRRTLVAAIPAAVRPSPSDLSRGSVGLLYPILANVQHVTTANLNSARGPQASNEHHSGGARGPQASNEHQSGHLPIPDSAGQQQSGLPRMDGGGTQNVEGFSTQFHSGLDQFLSTIFPGEHMDVGSNNFQGMDAVSARGVGGMTQDAANTQEAASRLNDEGTFLSNVLRQIMPIISQSSATGSNNAPEEGAGDIEAQENLDIGTSSRRRGDPSSPPISKRQKRE
ncbi:ubiquitin-like domain-containing protein CIP73 isoform X2 [Cornus florida]|nr:ubiquitin-like domain-containing protein CIP73 isoform X2 [Cornus florida]